MKTVVVLVALLAIGGCEPIERDAATAGDAGPADPGPLPPPWNPPADDEWVQPPGDDDALPVGLGSASEDIADAAPGVWHWVDVAESRCGEGSSTGFAVRRSRHDDADLLLFLEDGGACWSSGTCPSLAFHVDTGFPASRMGWWLRLYDDEGIFDDGDDDNPFARHHVVFVPYCTGDVHAGAAIDNDYGVQHSGAANTDAMLARVAPHFTSDSLDVDEVVLAGMSAGAYGAVMNAHAAREAFAPRPVHLLVDSAAPKGTDFLQASLQDTWRARWNLDARLPPACPACVYYLDLFTWVIDSAPEMRVGVITSTRDQVIRRFYGFGYPADYLMPMNDFINGVNDLKDQLKDRPNFSWFTFVSTDHTFVWRNLDEVHSSDDVSLRRWLGGLVEGDERFTAAPPGVP